MKKLLIILFCLAISCSGFSQSEKFTLGPKIGVNFSKLSSNIDTLKDNMKPGFEVGAFVRIGGKFYIQPEVMFKTKGGKIDIETDVQESKYKFKLLTLDVPLIVGLKLIDHKAVNVRIMLGPVVSFIMNKDIDSGSSDKVFDENDFKDTNWGFQFGAGVDFLILTVDVRYELGLTDLYDGKISQKEWESKNNLFSIAVGIKIF